ncbi:hypothetical protein [Chryseobacterium indoltheticum]|uniref:hypothetical protein n=1 Tax=Chryseobacterium indoltheticum TaxID=254 RepID=UPI003F49599C
MVEKVIYSHAKIALRVNGNKLDKELLRFLQNIDSRNQKPNSKLNTKITNSSIGNNNLNAELSYDKNGNFF